MLLVAVVLQLAFLFAAQAASVPSPGVKLVGGKSPGEGYAMMYYKSKTGNGKYGYICDKYVIPRGWPSVLCIQLGYDKALTIKKGRPAGFNGQEFAFKCPACSPATAKTMQQCGHDKVQNCN